MRSNPFAHDLARLGPPAQDHGPDWGEVDTSLLGSGRRPAPAFPLDILDPFWAEWCRSRAEAVTAPVDYVAMALLAAAGGVLANVRQPLAGAGWCEPPHLWAGLVGLPSSGKTPALEAVLDLMRAAEGTLAEGFDDVRRQYETEKRTAAIRREMWEAEHRDAVKGGFPAPPMPAEAEEPPEPVRPRIRVADATTEALVKLAAALPRGLLMVRDEVSGWLAGFDRYGGNGADRAFALEMWNGRSYVVDRVKAGKPVHVPRLSIGVLGGVQPDKLAMVTDGPDDGLAARFLWTWPDAVPGFRLCREHLDDTAARRAFQRLAALPMGSDEEGRPEPLRVRLAREAEDVLEAYGQDVAHRSVHAFGMVASWMGKARGLALRLSLILTYLDWSASLLNMEPTEIEATTVKAAVGFLSDYAEPMVERVVGDAAMPRPERLARALVAVLRRTGELEFNARALRREVGGPFREAAAMDEACAVLVEANLIRPMPNQAKGRPPKAYAVNPAMLGDQSANPVPKVPNVPKVATVESFGTFGTIGTGTDRREAASTAKRDASPSPPPRNLVPFERWRMDTERNTEIVTFFYLSAGSRGVKAAAGPLVLLKDQPSAGHPRWVEATLLEGRNRTGSAGGPWPYWLLVVDGRHDDAPFPTNPDAFDAWFTDWARESSVRVIGDWRDEARADGALDGLKRREGGGHA